MSRVVITDHVFASLTIERELLAAVGAEPVTLQATTEADLLGAVADADALLVCYAPISRRVIEGMHRCRIIARYGIGVDNVDREAASAKGIVDERPRLLRRRSERPCLGPPPRLRAQGPTAQRPRPGRTVGGDGRRSDPSPARPEELRAMKRTAHPINTARGPLMEEAPLIQALREGWIAGAALDVMEHEPPGADHPAAHLENLIPTPHVAFYAEESVQGLQRKATDEVVRALWGQLPRAPVNRPGPVAG
ncbi:MAG TPA: NAD(P)-dependent oxidoreductase [bacterium]|nr:NAD(P)-dependent oxidoreductase [bacterium]